DPESSTSSFSATFGTAVPLPRVEPSPNLKLTSVWCINTKSRKDRLPNASYTFARARELVSSTQLFFAPIGIFPVGSMINEPKAPLLVCLIGSDETKLVPPNSIGTRLPTAVVGSIFSSPAYHRYLTLNPGAAV